MEQNNNGISEKLIDVLQDIENNLKHIYGELLTANTNYETIVNKLSDIASNTEHIL